MRLIDGDALSYNLDGMMAVSPTGYIHGDTIADMIGDAPTIEPERKKGVWLPDNNNYYEERFICSICGKSYKVDTCMGKPMWDFCPCGADMRGEGDTE